jgi:hypothetical protein
MPNGKIARFEVPEGLSPEQAQQLISQNLPAQTDEKPKESSSLLRRAGDLGLSLGQGVLGLGEAAVGLADIPTFGLAGKAATAGEKALFGGTTQDAQKYLEELKTPETRQAEQNVANAKGFLGTSKAYLENPSALLGTIAESVPSMVGAAGIARTGLSLAERAAAKKLGLSAEEYAAKKATETAGMSAAEKEAAYKASENKALMASAAGEAAVSAGSTAEQIRQQEENGLLSPGQAAIAGVSGALTGTLGIFGGKVADKLEVQDMQRLFMGDIRKKGAQEESKSILVSAVKSAITESAFEELPQSMQEQIAQNIATDKPWDEGVAEAAASGAMSALVMGGASGASSQAITNAQNKIAEKKKEALASKQGLNAYDEADQKEEEEKAKEETKQAETTQKAGDTSFNFNAEQDAINQINQNREDNKGKFATKAAEDEMIDPDTGFPYFSGDRRSEQAKQEYVDANAQLDAAIKSGKEGDYELALERVKKARAEMDAVNSGKLGEQAGLPDTTSEQGKVGEKQRLDDLLKQRFGEDVTTTTKPKPKNTAVQGTLFGDEDLAQNTQRTDESGKAGEQDIYGPNRKFTVMHNGEPWTYFGPGAEVVQQHYPGSPAKVKKVTRDKNGNTGYIVEIDTSNHPEAVDENGNQINTKEGFYTDEQLNRLNPPTEQAPQNTQRGFDFGEPTDERAKKIEPNKPIAQGQQRLDFEQEQPVVEETTPKKTEKPKFGYTTETSATPLINFLSRFKPRSTSENERTKQQNALEMLVDQIRELYDGATNEQRPYIKGLVDSFFDKYASGVNLPSEKSDLKRLHTSNLTPAQQKEILNKHTHLPDLTTYEGVRELSDAFQEHVADAQLAGLGITKSSSAYKKAVPFVRALKNKAPSTYDEEEKAAHAYFSKFNFYLALRSAAFDIAVNTPRNQLFRGQGKDFAEDFKKWLAKNSPKEIQDEFDAYIEAYKKQNEGFKAFQELMTNAENEAKYKQSYTENGPQNTKVNLDRAFMESKPMHPAAIEAINNNDLQTALGIISATTASPFYKNLASRLRELKLPTTIGVDILETLADDYTQKTRFLLGKFAGIAQSLMPNQFGNENFINVVHKIWDNRSTNEARFNAARETIDLIHERLKENGITEGTVYDVLKDLNNNVNNMLDSFDSSGTYFPKSDAVNISFKNTAPNSTTYVFLHELVHAATTRVINNKALYSNKQRAAVEELEKLFDHVKQHIIDNNLTESKYYGMTDLNEFVAEAFTDKKFQDFLMGIKYKYSNQSLWDKFVTFCLNIIGQDNVLAATIANANAVFRVTKDNTFTNAPPQYAKRNAGMFESNSNERSKPFEIFKDLVKNNKSWPEVKGKFANAIDTMNTQTRKHWLGAFTLRQMEEMIGYVYDKDPVTGEMKWLHKLPQISRFINKIGEMVNKRSKIIEQATNISKKLMAIQSEDKPTIDKLTQIIQTATTSEVDPTQQAPIPVDPNNITAEEQAKIDAYHMLRKEWDALGAMRQGLEAQKLYSEMKQFYIDRLDEFKKIALEREYERLLDIAKRDDKQSGANIFVNTNSPAYQAEIQNIHAQAKKNIDERYKDSIKPYFPLKRFGDFWVRVGKGESRRYYQFEDARAKNRFLDAEKAKLVNKLVKQGYKSDEAIKLANLPENINHGNALPEMSNDLFTDKAVFDQVKDIVEKAGGSNIVDVEQLRKLLSDEIGQLYITTLPLQSIQRMFLHRQNIAGASADLIRSFQHSAFHMAYQHARYEYAPSLDLELAAASDTIRHWPNSDEKAVLQDYFNEIDRKYKENVLKPPPSNPMVNALSSFNFLMYLTAPASAIVNMLAVPSIALPVLGGKFGSVKSWKAMMRNMKLLTSSGWANEIGKDDKGNPITEFDVPSLKRAKGLSKAQIKALDMASENLLNQSLAHDAAALAEHPSLEYTGRWGKIMQIASFPFHKAERFNREITFLSAFDLAYEKNGGNLEAAVKEASDLTWKTMFDYATYNKARYFQGNTAKIMLAFKQYAQHMTYLLFRTAFEATKGIDKAEYEAIKAHAGEAAAIKYMKETNEIQAQARKTFMYLMGTSFLFAGSTGLPIWWMYEGIAKAFNAVYGDPNVPFDVENDFKNRMNDIFGGFAGDSISRGVIPQLTGASLSDRMSTNIGDMWFRDTKKNLDEVEWVNQTLINLMGPSAGALVNAAEAVKRYKEGNPERAFEMIAPAAVKNLMAGTRLATEGALTLKGDTLMENVSGYQAFLQMLGFTPEELAQKQSANIEAKAAEQEVMGRRQDLLNFLALSIAQGDEEGEAKVLAKIEDFNNANEWAGIKGKDIRNSLKKREQVKEMANELGGLRVNKYFNDIAKEKTAYANDEDEE